MQVLNQLKAQAISTILALLSLIRIQSKGAQDGLDAERFVRVLNPVDPWLRSDAADERENQFMGGGGNISVAMTSRCKDSIILASFHGARRKTGLIRPSLFCFYSQEVHGLGGNIEDTNADPPWPPEYNYAHHDITRAHRAVASAMSDLSQKDPSRVSQYSEISIFTEIALLLQRHDLPQEDKKFRPKAAYRLRRLFLDGVELREIWIEVAKAVPKIAYDEQIMSEFRRMWINDRKQWNELSAKLPIIANDKRFSSG